MGAFDPLTSHEISLQVGHRHILMVKLDVIAAHPPSGAIAWLQGAMVKYVRLGSLRLAGDH